MEGLERYIVRPAFAEIEAILLPMTEAARGMWVVEAVEALLDVSLESKIRE